MICILIYMLCIYIYMICFDMFYRLNFQNRTRSINLYLSNHFVEYLYSVHLIHLNSSVDNSPIFLEHIDLSHSEILEWDY